MGVAERGTMDGTGWVILVTGTLRMGVIGPVFLGGDLNTTFCGGLLEGDDLLRSAEVMVVRVVATVGRTGEGKE